MVLTMSTGTGLSGLVISPYTKRGEVVSTYYSQINMVRTIENILGITSDEPARSVCRTNG